MGKSRKEHDTVDLLLYGFSERPDRPRILPDAKDFTPTPPPPMVAERRFESTNAGKRVRMRNFVAGTLIGFFLVITIGAVLIHTHISH